jgi:DNA-binding SARP family transcriptional activator
LTIGLCGRLTATVAGAARDQALPGRQGRLVLAYLALHQDRPVSRDELVQAVWGDEGGAGLAVVLSRLRGALGPEAVEGDRGAPVQLAAGAEVDLHAARAGLAGVRAALAREDWAAVLAPARRIVELTDRGLLAGLDAPWIEEARRGVEELGLEARDALAAAHLGLGTRADLSAAEDLARALVERAPYRESGHALLMAVLEAEGNVAEALRVYDRLRLLLREELGIVPGAQVQAILDRLLRADAPGRAATPAAAAPAPVAPEARPMPPLPFFATRSRARFVGRTAELERLRGHLARAGAGERQLVLLEGEPGIGKTRLAAEFAAESGAAGVAVLYGRCDAETLIPYQPFLEALRAHLAGLAAEEREARLGPYVADLARVLPELDPEGRRPVSDTPGETERYRLFEAVSAVLVEISREQPVLLVLDDLHWADRPTLHMLRQAVRATEHARIVVLVTFRDTERGDALLDALADLRREHFLERIVLGGLPDDDASALLRELAEQNETGRGPDAALLQETMGNPFFLEEMARAADPSAGAGGARPGAPGAIPDGIRDVLGRRLARLSERTRRMLGAAAVIGREVPLDVLEAVAGLDEDELDESVEEAVGAHVLQEVPGAYGRFTFAHALIRQTVYEDLTGMRRARLHARVAEVLERTAGDDPAWLSGLAHHCFRAPPAQWLGHAIDYAERAAVYADGQLAYEEAARLYELALEGAGHAAPDPARRARLLQGLGEAQVKAGNTGAARRVFIEAAAAARERGDAGALAGAALGHGMTGHMAGGVVDRTTVALLDEALAAVGDTDGPVRARLLARLAIELSFSGDRARRDGLSADALALARRLGDAAAVGYALIARHWCLWGPENVEERLATADALLALAAASEDPKLLRQGARWRMIDLLEVGDIAAVDAGIAAVARHAQAERLSERFYLQLFAAMRALFAGRFDEVEALSRDAAQLGERVQDPNASQAHVLQLLALRREQGRLEEMAGPVADHAARFTAIPGWRCVEAQLRAELGDREGALAEVAALAADDCAALPLDGLWLGAVAVLAETVVMLGARELAQPLYGLLLPYEQRNVVIGYASTCTGSAARQLGLLAGLLGRPQDAARHFEAALAFNERMGAAPWVARTELAYAALLLGSDRHEHGCALLEQARARGEALGMPALVREADALGGVPAG